MPNGSPLKGRSAADRRMQRILFLLTLLLLAGCSLDRSWSGRFQHRPYRPKAPSPERIVRLERQSPPERMVFRRSSVRVEHPATVSMIPIRTDRVLPGRLSEASPRVVRLDRKRRSEAPQVEHLRPGPKAGRSHEQDTERTTWNWLSVASPIILVIALVAAIPAQSTELLLLGCLAALAAAIIGARQCREKGQKGQGFAMAVMGFAAAGALIAILALLARLG